jgi:hypothetical protein
MQQIDRMMRQAISDKIFPGAVLLVSQEVAVPICFPGQR